MALLNASKPLISKVYNYILYESPLIMAEDDHGNSFSNHVGHSSSARADADDEYGRTYEERASIEDGFRTDSLPSPLLHVFPNSPLRTSYVFSLLGPRLRRVSASQLLAIGFPNPPELLFESPTQKTEIVESSCEQQTLSKHYSQPERNNQADETNHFSFVSVAYHPVDAERRCLRAEEDCRKFAADDNSSNPPEDSSRRWHRQC